MTVYRFSQLLPDGLVRDPVRGRVAGVCAGLGGYFGIKPKFVRLFFILMSVFGFFFFTVALYIILALLIPQAPTGFAYGSFDPARSTVSRICVTISPSSIAGLPESRRGSRLTITACGKSSGIFNDSPVILTPVLQEGRHGGSSG